MSLDVPYSDSFAVISHFEFEGKAGECQLSIRTEVKWLKSVWMLKGTIESKAVEGSTAFLNAWLEVVKRKSTEIETSAIVGTAPEVPSSGPAVSLHVHLSLHFSDHPVP